MNLKKTVKAILAVILVLIIIISFATVFLSSFGLRKQLNWMPFALLSVESGSMEPKISAGDLIIVSEKPFEELKTGDIITYADSKGGFTTHQLLRIDGDTFYTKGIANKAEDEPVNKGMYCASLVAVLPKLGFVFDFLTQPVVAVILILLIAFLFYGIPFIKGLVKKNNTEDNSDNKHKSIGLKHLTALALASIFATTPFMTAARYIEHINGFEAMQAAHINFKSNYMTQISGAGGGSNYLFKGWNGVKAGLEIQIQNFSNQLLCNDTVDVPYIIYLEPVSDMQEDTIDPSKFELDLYCHENVKTYAPNTIGENTNAYTDENKGNIKNVKFDDSAKDYHRDTSGNTWNKDYISGPFILQHSSSPTYDAFTLSIQLKEGIEINGEERSETKVKYGDKAKFRLMACTDKGKDFYQELLGTYTFQLADANSFLTTEISDTGASSFYAVLNTHNLVGVVSKDIYIYWDARRVYLDELDPTSANLIANAGDGNYYDGRSIPKPDSQDDNIGSLKINLHGDSRIKLLFIKRINDTYPDAAQEDLSGKIYISEKSKIEDSESYNIWRAGLGS